MQEQTPAPGQDGVLTQQQLHFRQMTVTPVPRLVWHLAVPTIVSMLVSSLYNMADTFFVSQLGTSAAGAVGIVFSLMAVIQAVGFTLGMGAGNTVARQLGAKQREAATETASSGFFAALGFGAVLLVLGSVFRTPLMRLLGATDTILPYAADYAQYILLAAPLMAASFVMNNLLRGEGRAALAMVGITAGGVLNMGLDPLFIFTFKLGIAGAAIATALSQGVSFCILLSFFLRGKSDVRLRISCVARRWKVYRRILTTGMPSLCRQGLASIATMLLNVQAAFYGDAAVAAMSIVGRFFLLLFSVMLGFGQGFQPVAGFNWGAGRYGRVREATAYTVKVGTLLMLGAAVLGYVFAPQVMTAFRRDDPAVIALGTLAFRAQCFALPLFGLSTGTNMALQCTGHSGPATFLALCRQGLYFLPLILVLPQLCGVLGVQLAQPIADGLSFCTSLPFFFRFLAELSRREKEAAGAPREPAQNSMQEDL